MAIYKTDIAEIDLNNGSICRSFLNRSIGEGDINADQFGVRVLRGGEEVNLNGVTVTGYFIRPDGSTVVLNNGQTAEGNVAFVTLEQTCYAVEGQFSLAIKLTGGGVTGTMRIVDGVVSNTTTGTIVDPGTVIPSIEDLIEAIEEAVASIPQDYSYVEAIAEATLHDVTWEQGSVNTTTGKKSSSTYMIRTEQFNIDAFIQASSSSPVKVQAACWDAQKNWLGKTSTAYSLTKDGIINNFSGAAYVMIIARHNSEQALTPSDVDTYDIKCAISESKLNASDDTRLPTLDDLQNKYDANGVLSETVNFGWNTTSDRNVVVQFCAKYTGNDKPYFLGRCYNAAGTRLMNAQTYYFEGKTEFIKQSFRIPNGYAVAKQTFTITIPSGSTLELKGFDCYYEDSVRKGTGNIAIHAHRGWDILYPDGSYNAIVAAAEMGHQSCVVIPKFTSDNVAVEFHDDTSISGQMTQMDGSPIPEQYDVGIGQLTYDQLMQWSIGYKTDPIYADQKILLMDDFFQICARTGMRPIFSIHSADAPTDSEWQTLGAMLAKYKLTRYLSVKAGYNQGVWKKVVDYVGDPFSLIYLYGTTAEYDIVAAVQAEITASGVDTTKTRIDCEFFEDSLEGQTRGELQTAQLQAAVAAGYTVSVVLNADATSDTLRKYMNMGVTEFTNKRHTSIGLNW